VPGKPPGRRLGSFLWPPPPWLLRRRRRRSTLGRHHPCPWGRRSRRLRRCSRRSRSCGRHASLRAAAGAGDFRCELFLRVEEGDGFDGRGFGRRFDRRDFAGWRQYFDGDDEDLLVQRIEECREREVLADTIPDRKHPDTGGPSLLLLPWLAALVGAGIMVLRRPRPPARTWRNSATGRRTRPTRYSRKLRRSTSLPNISRSSPRTPPPGTPQRGLEWRRGPRWSRPRSCVGWRSWTSRWIQTDSRGHDPDVVGGGTTGPGRRCLEGGCGEPAGGSVPQEVTSLS
jgi:hypothetical protein